MNKKNFPLPGDEEDVVGKPDGEEKGIQEENIVKGLRV